MEEHKNKILKQGVLKTDADFTSNLMDKINAEEKALSNVLAKHGSVTPSVDFTAQFMQQLEVKTTPTPYQQVISKKGWIAIAAVFTGIISLSLFTGVNGSIDFGWEAINFKHFTAKMNGLLIKDVTFHYIILGAFVLSVGLFVEQQMRRRVSFNG